MSTLMFSTLIALVMSGCTNNNLSLKYKPGTSTRELVFAMQQKDLVRFKELINDASMSKNIDKNYEDGNGNNLLWYAIDAKNRDMVRYLISRDVDVNKVNKAGDSLLKLAVSNEFRGAVIDLMCTNKIDLSYVDANGNNPLMSAIKKRLPEICLDLIRFAPGMCNCVNKVGDTPLVLAIKNKHGESDKFSVIGNLVRNGKSDLNYVDQNGNRPLILAIMEGLSVTASELIDLGVNLDGQALCLAAEKGLVDVIFEILSKDKSLINFVDKDGRTALHCAILKRQVGSAKALIAFKASTNIKDKAGKTAEDYAKEAKGHDFNFVSKL